MAELPDFLRLPDEDVAREKLRQERLRQDFNSRARLSAVEVEFGRAQAMQKTLEQNARAATEPEDKAHAKRQLAEAYAAQGYFLKASRITTDADERKFYKKAAEAIFNGRECACSPPIETIGGKQLRLPKYRVIREVNSVKHGQFGFLVECNRCENWTFVGSHPLPERIDPAKFDPETTPNDLEILRA